MTAEGPVRIGVIGGTGLYDMPLDDRREVAVSTPYGDPSDVITIGGIEGTQVAFLPRHGRGHRILPTELPSRANVYALKQLGVEHVISVSAVGSLREEIAPLHLVVPDQIIDRTRLREHTFFGDGVAAHVAFADPFCAELGAVLADAAATTGAEAHRGGTLIVMEGPAFSTKAESALYRSWGASIIGMTALPEAKLAREAEMCYAMLACATDYDVWREGHDEVTVEMIVANLHRNAETSRETLRRVVPALAGLELRTCACADALRTSIVTAKEHMPAETVARLGPIVAKYLG